MARRKPATFWNVAVSLNELSNRRTEPDPPRPPPERAGPQRHWVEIFTDGITEPLKEVLQEDMDWMTSRPILERLNRLYDIEHSRGDDKAETDITRPYVRRPGSSR